MKTIKEFLAEAQPKWTVTFKSDHDDVEVVAPSTSAASKKAVKAADKQGKKGGMPVTDKITKVTESTITEKLSGSKLKKVEKQLDDLMNSEVGRDLSVAWGDGDESKAEKILSRENIKGKNLDNLIIVMFGEQ